jgi:hypothetical protein
LEHLLQRIDATPALDSPFSHIYLEHVFPEDVYAQLLSHLPNPELYNKAAERHYEKGEGNCVRSLFQLTAVNLGCLSLEQRELWRGVAAALTDPRLKQVMYTKLARDLSFRYGVAEAEVGRLAGFSRPTLHRETEGFEIAPHPDTRKKVVTMQLYLPADRSQLELGTALYRHKLLALPFGDWHRRFARVKQFVFQPNSGYAFVVNNTLTKKSWHGREKLPEGAGVRNTLLNTFYESCREEFAGNQAVRARAAELAGIRARYLTPASGRATITSS